jgi:DNA primase
MGKYGVDLLEYDIVNIARDLGLRIKNESKTTKEIAACCPFCPSGDTKYHLNLNRFINVFRCPKCGTHGGILHLVAYLKGVDTREAYRMLKSGEGVYKSTADNTSYKEIKYTEHVEEEQNTKSISERHKVYTRFLDMLTLSDKHKTNLLQRGLSKKVIEENQYKSIPQVDDIRKRICWKLSLKYDLKGIAGFFTDKYNDWDFYSNPGFLIPVRNERKEIQGMQVRIDNCDNRKYRYFSSVNYENGAPAKSYVHIAKMPVNGQIRLTEGPLKADVASYLSGEPYIAIPGINSYKYLVPMIKSLEVHTVFEDFDMDKYSKKEVSKGVATVKKLLHQEGIKVISAKWDSRYKGVDDYLLSLYTAAII